MATTISEGVGTRETGRLPSWLKGVNRVVMALQRVGFVVGTMHVLAVPGRRSGVYRSTPVSLMTVDGHRYIVAGLDDADWVLNARVAGRGIPAEALPHVFDRFWKSADSGGSGLGLAIARGLVEAHGGKIRADSVEGRGTVVSFTLPVERVEKKLSVVSRQS